mmetsp:Transcript_107999/g.186342  ORF Transcript_107999/g.186342 Transcript_107999/m.186342 type:complete len:84 (-) Transcript_107999:605-856(-)
MLFVPQYTPPYFSSEKTFSSTILSPSPGHLGSKLCTQQSRKYCWGADHSIAEITTTLLGPVTRSSSPVTSHSRCDEYFTLPSP